MADPEAGPSSADAWGGGSGPRSLRLRDPHRDRADVAVPDPAADAFVHGFAGRGEHERGDAAGDRICLKFRAGAPI